MFCCAKPDAWSRASTWSTRCSVASFLPLTAVSICTSAKFSRSWATPITAAITSKQCVEWDTSLLILATPPRIQRPRSRKHEKPVSQDLSLLLDGVCALPGLDDYRDSPGAAVRGTF